MNRTIFFLAGVCGASSLLLVDSAIKGAALLMLAAVSAIILRRDSAATRHLVWLLAMVGMLVVPVLSAMLPEWRALPAWASIPPAAGVAPASQTSLVGPAVGAGYEAQLVAPVDSERTSTTAYEPVAAPSDSRPEIAASESTAASVVWSWSWLSALPLAWVIGFSTLVLRLVAARWMLWMIERQGTVIGSSTQLKDTHDPIVAALEATSLQLGIGRPVTLLIHPGKTIPVVWGIFRCRLLLPAAARQWSGEQLRSVLLHELAHIRRADTVAQLLAQIACALHWFNPLAWIAAWRLGVERERACDDLVLASGVRPSAYARHLLDVVAELSPAPWTQSCGLAMARKSSLESRLVAVLSGNLNRRGVSLTLAAIALAIGIGIAVPVAMLRAVERPVDVAAAGADAQATDDGAAPQNESPRNSTAVFLLNQWQSLEGRKTPLSEASIARLRVAIDKWVQQPTAKPDAALVMKLRNWRQSRAEHPVAEVAAWLDEIAAIHPGSLAFAIGSETLVGSALSAERQAALKFGPAAENGLRAAWSRYPARETYLPGDVISSSLVIQNVSERNIEFECPHSLESITTWEAKTADGRTVEAKPWRTTGTFPLFTWRLKPGAIAEIQGRGVAIGESGRPAGVSDSAMLNRLEAKRGEQITVHWTVREPVAMSTADVSFKVVDIADMPAWSTLQAGAWPLPGGVRLEVKQQLVHAADISSTAILTWPTDKSGDTARYKVWLGGDAFSNRAPWQLAWERGATVLWMMSGERQSPQDFRKVMPTPSSLRRIDFSNPNDIVETTWSYTPKLVPAAIRAEFAKGFLPLASTPHTPAHATPSVRAARAEDIRPVTELLNGTWKGRKGAVDVSITFPVRTNDQVTWSMTFTHPQSPAPINDSLTRMKTPHDGSVELVKTYTAPRRGQAPVRATLGRLKRGIGDTLLLDIMAHVDFPGYQSTQGIVLVSDSTPESKPTESKTTEAKPIASEPQHEYARSLLKKWRANARTDGKIPGALIGHVAKEVDSFLRQYPDNDKAPQLAALRARLDASRDWTQAEVVALLDDITAISTAPVSWAETPMEFSAMRSVQGGQPLPVELTSAAWGRPAANGLRAAWLLEPRAEQHALGSVLKARVLFHNAGTAPVVFRTETWHQNDAHTARDAKGAEIKVGSVWYTGITPMATYRLDPGEYCEVAGHGIGIGAGEYAEERSTGSVGAWIEANVGEVVRFSSSVDASYGGWTRPGDPKDPAELWKATIAERIANEAPMPRAAADREQLIRRVTRHLFGEPPTAEEIAAFIADDAPDALTKLSARLQAKERIEPFAGKLPTGETTFRVIAADPNAAKAPRAANGPGRYVLGEGAHLLVSQITDGDRRANEAVIAFLSPDPKVASPHKPYQIALPDGLASYGIVWDRGAGALWVLQEGLVREYDFRNPAQVQEMRVEPGNIINVPEHMREALKKAVNVPDAQK